MKMKKREVQGKKAGRKFRKAVIILFLLWILAGVIQNADSAVNFLFEVTGINDASHIIPASEEWNLIVVNRWNEIPEDFSVSLTELSNGQKVDSRIYSYLQEMFDAAKEEGLYLIVREGYRTAEEQEEIFNGKVQAYRNEGYSKARAKRLAKKWVALPGTSEHQLGIAVDINADKDRSANDEAYVWLAENAHRYGFILRYPQGKEDITGTSYEPWHFRYVGIENAQVIYEKQICLEEFRENAE